MTSLTPQVTTPINGFVKWWYFIVSAILGGAFVLFLTVGSVFYHWYQLIMKIETHKVKDNSYGDFKPKVPYKNMKKLKRTKNLGHYAEQLDLELKVYKITTTDGFILTLHRLIDPKDSDLVRDNKPPILLQHGLLLASGCFLTAGYNSLAYYFVESGYDVWMGNNRAWFKKEHATLKNLATNQKYWDWDVRHFAFYDLPCIIDSVLDRKPNHTQLTLVGHSQGCTQSFMLLKNPDLGNYHKKINTFIALAPAIYPGLLFYHRFFLKFMHALNPITSKLFYGTLNFLPILTTTRRMMATNPLFGKVAYYLFKFLFGWNGSKWGPSHKVWHIHFIFNVSYVSSKLMNWWVSAWKPEGFSNQLYPKEAYANGDHCAFTPVNTKEDADAAEAAQDEAQEKAKKEHIIDIDDSASFFPYKQPWFGQDSKSTVVPMVVFIGRLDYLVDGERLATHLRHYEKDAYLEFGNLAIHELDDHSHMDVVWSEDCIPRIGYIVREHLEKLAV